MNNTETNSAESYECKIQDVKPLSSNTFQVELQSSEDTVLKYQAGQYLQLKLDVNNDGGIMSLSYSIANGYDPKYPNRLQLFIHNNSEFSGKVLKRLSEISKDNKNVNINLPLGQAYLQTDLNLPHVLIAAGSGISKIKCISEAILKQKPDAQVNIYWSNKNIDEFYLLSEFQHWSHHHKNLSFTPILEASNSHWAGRSGLIYEVIQDDFKHLNNAQTYLCGSPQMVYGTIDQLKVIGLKETNCYSDVFEYAPREQRIAI